MTVVTIAVWTVGQQIWSSFLGSWASLGRAADLEQFGQQILGSLGSWAADLGQFGQLGSRSWAVLGAAGLGKFGQGNRSWAAGLSSLEARQILGSLGSWAAGLGSMGRAR